MSVVAFYPVVESIAPNEAVAQKMRTFLATMYNACPYRSKFQPKADKLNDGRCIVMFWGNGDRCVGEIFSESETISFPHERAVKTWDYLLS